MIITVTQDDIDKGCKGKAQACAIARALVRTVPNAAEAVVCIFFQVIDVHGHNLLECDIPDHVGDWITRFDNGKHVEPFSFWIGEAEPFVVPVLAKELVPA